MKKKVLFLFGLLIAVSFSAKAEMNVADFEDGSTPPTFEIAGNCIAEFSIIDNPDMTDLNPSEKVLYIKNVSEGGEWWGGLNINFTPVAINEENRYIHIMMKTELGAAEFDFITNEENENEYWAGNFTPASTDWIDYVYDLKSFNNHNISGKNLAGFRIIVNIASNFDKITYIDEIVINNDPLPRSPVIRNAAVLADFEDEGISPASGDEGGGTSEISVVDNPDKSGLNKTNKVLYAKTATVSGEWWAGLQIQFDIPVYINDDTRYIHIMLKSDMPKLEFDFRTTNDNWGGGFTPSNTWTEYVIDLQEFNSINLKDNILTGLRIVTFPNEAAAREKNIYIDEIVINDNPTPRTDPGAGAGTDNTIETTGAIYSIDGGIAINGIAGDVYVYNLQGSLIYQAVSTGELTINLKQGLYIVSANNQNQKVLVK